MRSIHGLSIRWARLSAGLRAHLAVNGSCRPPPSHASSRRSWFGNCMRELSKICCVEKVTLFSCETLSIMRVLSVSVTQDRSVGCNLGAHASRIVLDVPMPLQGSAGAAAVPDAFSCRDAGGLRRRRRLRRSGSPVLRRPRCDACGTHRPPAAHQTGGTAPAWPPSRDSLP